MQQPRTGSPASQWWPIWGLKERSLPKASGLPASERSSPPRPRLPAWALVFVLWGVFRPMRRNYTFRMTAPPARPLRVLTLVDGIGTYGGAESLARQIAMNLDRSRFESTFCVSRWEPRASYERGLVELRDAGVRFLGLERRSRFNLAAWRRLVAQMRERRVDVLHSHKIGSNIWGALLSPLARTPVFVAHEHTWSFEGQPQRRFLDRELIARRADAFVAVSEEDRQRMHEIEGIPIEKLRFIPNGIPTPAAPDPGADVRAELGIAPDQPTIGVVATLRPQKALDVLIRASIPLTLEFPGLQVLIVGGEAGGLEGGPDPEREKLEQLARGLGVADNVRVLGHRPDIPNVLEALDVAVLSSDFEGSPLSVMEYMEAGKPVVSTRVGGVPDLVEDGVTGLLVEPQDPAALAAAIARLLRDPDESARMGEAGRERRRGEFSIENTTRCVEALYEELYAAKVGAGAGG
jgi:glycosyltransferase involved in cell wall biosynthesis